MTFRLNGTEIEDLWLNGVQIDKAYLNNVEVYKAFGTHIITPEREESGDFWGFRTNSSRQSYNIGSISPSRLVGTSFLEYLFTARTFDGKYYTTAEFDTRVGTGLRVKVENGTTYYIKWGVARFCPELEVLLINTGVPFTIELSIY